MHWASMIGPLAGGIGLFLLGMWLMTDGLKVAAGPALQRILAQSTGTRARAFASGIAITALVQSSSVVTVAAIGFINAGLLSLNGVLWVLFGANVGTTMTGWLVALAGVDFKIEAIALPLVGVGMVLHLTAQGRRRGALGLALAGFGTLFLGIDVLRDAFSGVGAALDLPAFGGGALALIAQVLTGAAMTVLMQSSSAALAVALTAAQGGVLPLEAAAAVVVGANLGTTVKALLAAIGATPNAKRAALGHVIFNLLTAAVALLILPWLLAGILALAAALRLEAGPAPILALFHTVFNLLGVLLIWPLAARLARFLEGRFRTGEEDRARPRYLDDSVLAVPELALVALERELRRMGTLALELVRRARVAATPAAALAQDQQAVAALNRSIATFIARLNRASMAPDTGARLPQLLRAARYYENVAELAAETAARPMPLLPGRCMELDRFMEAAGILLNDADPQSGPAPRASAPERLAALQADYEAAKVALLEAGAHGQLDVAEMDAALDRASLTRRSVEQSAKGARLLLQLSPQGVSDSAQDGEAGRETA
jgi:phosphate:Na+ symporter